MHRTALTEEEELELALALSSAEVAQHERKAWAAPPPGRSNPARSAPRAQQASARNAAGSAASPKGSGHPVRPPGLLDRVADAVQSKSGSASGSSTPATRSNSAPLSKHASIGNDDAPATATHERGSKSRLSPGHAASHAGYASSCPICGLPLGAGTHVRQPTTGAPIHMACFKCGLCGEPITEQFTISHENNTIPLHPKCAEQMYLPQCRVSGALMNKFSTHPFWQDTYCPKHHTDGTPRCDSCERMHAKDAPSYHRVDEARVVCDQCINTVLLETADAQPLYREVLAFFASQVMALDAMPPLGLVEESALNASARDPKARHAGHQRQCRGMTFAEMHQRMVRRGLGPAVPDGPPVVEVNAIFALKGFPRLTTGVITAHEVMHAYLKCQGLVNLRPEVEEGLCELMGRLWLEAQPQASNASPFEGKMREFLLWHQEHNQDSVYGGGFRSVLRAYRKHGLRKVLDHVRRTKALPT